MNTLSTVPTETRSSQTGLSTASTSRQPKHGDPMSCEAIKNHATVKLRQADQQTSAFHAKGKGCVSSVFRLPSCRTLFKLIYSLLYFSRKVKPSVVSLP